MASKALLNISALKRIEDFGILNCGVKEDALLDLLHGGFIERGITDDGMPGFIVSAAGTRALRERFGPRKYHRACDARPLCRECALKVEQAGVNFK
ncbi:MAG TPA: hypothetical protein VK974_00865 [Methylophilaceae bacterium]|nr:hypothetical protein [Methylophilaceae bacterium]